jgi:hypothetical protein
MASYQLLTCTIALAGDIQQVVSRGAERPVTYPELIVLQFLHGEQAVTEVFECGYTEDREPRHEKERLMGIYGGPLVDKQLFPGHNIQMPVKNEKYKPRMVGTLINPGPPIPAEPPLEIDPDIVAGATRQVTVDRPLANLKAR